ncbi:MAG TPA: hypothetical protein DCO83_10830 [Mucilaginibacter sp.]|jgi:hypothetical protein|nr:hypothetical protein [Mucilaginibacter sp.]
MGDVSAEKPRQSFGKRSAKLFLPVLIGLHLPFLYIQTDSLLNPIELDKAGKGAMDGLWFFDYVFFPGLLVILLIPQWLIIVPVWNRMCLRARRVLLSSLSIGILLSILTGALLGYLVWINKLGPNNNQPGLNELINPVLLMSGFVVVYCILNTLTLYFLDRSFIRHIKSQKLDAN